VIAMGRWMYTHRGRVPLQGLSDNSRSDDLNDCAVQNGRRCKGKLTNTAHLDKFFALGRKGI
jgi:hypothetical protein